MLLPSLWVISGYLYGPQLPFAAEVTQLAPAADPDEPDPDGLAEPDDAVAAGEAASADEEELADGDALDEGVADPDADEAEADGDA